MKSNLKRFLAKQTEALVEHLAQAPLIGEIDDKAVAQKIDRLMTYDKLAKLYDQTRSKNMLLPAAVGLISLVVVTLLWLVPVRSTPLSVSVNTTGVDLSFSGKTDLIEYIEGQRIFVSGFQSLSVPAANINTASKTGFQSISTNGAKIALKNLTVDGEVKMSVNYAQDALHLLLREGDQVSGEIEIIGTLQLIDSSSEGNEYRLGDSPDLPEDVLFLATGKAEKKDTPQRPKRLLTDIQILQPNLPLRIKGLRPAAVSFLRERHQLHPQAPPEFESTITGGQLILRHTGTTVPIHWGDALYLQGLSISYGEISVENGVQVRLEGDARQIRTGPSGYIRNRKPSLLEYHFHNHQIGFFWSAVTFVWTMLWALKRTVLK